MIVKNIFLILLLASPLAVVAQLNEMILQLEVPESEQKLVINTFLTEALLVVYTDVPELDFASSPKGVIRVEKEPGFHIVHLEPGTNNITFSAPQYAVLKEPIYIAQRAVKHISVKTKSKEMGKGSLKIETIPPGAVIKFNNLEIGRTPKDLPDQPTGKHRLSLKLDGYNPLDTSVFVEKDKTLTYKFTLRREFATLKVDTDPKGAEVFWEGKSLGLTPLTCDTLSPGEKEITIKKRGYINRTETVRLKAGEPKSSNFDLILQTGSAEITCDQNGAEIFFDEASCGLYQGKAIVKDKIPLGKHTVKAVLSGYEDAIASFEAQYAQPNNIVLNLKPKPGALFVSSTPEGAEIWLDGSNTGQKTAYNPVKIPLANPGDYRITLKKSDYQDTTQIVKIPPGGSKTIDIAMKAKPKPPQPTGVISSSPSSVIASEAKQSLQRKEKPLNWDVGLKLGLIISKYQDNYNWHSRDKHTVIVPSIGLFYTFRLYKNNFLKNEICFSQMSSDYMNIKEIEVPIIIGNNIFHKNNEIFQLNLGASVSLIRSYEEFFNLGYSRYRASVLIGCQLELNKLILVARSNIGIKITDDPFYSGAANESYHKSITLGIDYSLR